MIKQIIELSIFYLYCDCGYVYASKSFRVLDRELVHVAKNKTVQKVWFASKKKNLKPQTIKW